MSKVKKTIKQNKINTSGKALNKQAGKKSAEITELERRLEEAEETLRAIRLGEVDAIVVGEEAEEIYTLKSADHPYRVLVEEMNEGALTLLNDGTIVYCNRAFCKIVCSSPESTIGLNLSAFVHKISLKEYEALFRRAQRTNTRGELILNRMNSKSFSGVPASLSFSSIKIDEMPALSVLVSDLTEQNENKEILEAERLARSILDQTGEAIVVCDRKGMIIRANQAAHRLCKRNPLLEIFQDVLPIQLDSGAPFGNPNSESARSKEVVRNIQGYIDGHERVHLQISVGPLVSDEGDFGCVVTLADVTQRKQIEEILQKSLQARDEFLSIASHELKTPLTTLKFQVQLMQRMGVKDTGETLSSPAVAEKLEMANSQIKSLTSLIDNLLDVSRIRSNKLQLDKQPLDLSVLAQDVVKRFSLEEKTAGSKITFEKNGSVEGLFDKSRVEQVLVNLITNAIKYGDSKPIVVALKADKETATVIVKDQGIGISEDDQERIFNRFERAVSPTHFGGLGLGLYITKQIVEAHQGRIQVKSSVGKGSTFIAEFPL